MVARPRPVVGRPLAQNLYHSADDGKKERRRSLLRANEGFAPVHRIGWDICGEIDLVAAQRRWQDLIHFVISKTFDRDLPKYEFHSRGPCRSPVMDHVRARFDPNRNVFVPAGVCKPGVAAHPGTFHS